MRALVVGNNLQGATAIGQTLGADGIPITVHVPIHPRDTLEHLRHAFCDAVVFDCPRANCNGVCLLQQFRALGNRLPVLVIATHASMEAQVKCLDAGADDYLAAPYPLPVLRARLRALVRRQWPHLLTVLHVGGDLRLNLLTREATRGQRTVALTAREASLLEFLMRHAGEPCSRKLIREQAWGYRFDPGTKVLEVNINRLRAKLDDGFETRLIETVHGIGYRLSPWLSP